VCCSVLQCVAVCCSVLQYIAVWWQRVAVCCSVLQCVAVCCIVLQCGDSALQCVAVCCSVLQCVAVYCSVLQCIAVCCSVMQCVAMIVSETQSCGRRQNDFWNQLCVHYLRCNVLQCVTVCYSVLQCLAVCCSVSQHVAACCSVSHIWDQQCVHACCRVQHAHIIESTHHCVQEQTECRTSDINTHHRWNHKSLLQKSPIKEMIFCTHHRERTSLRSGADGMPHIWHQLHTCVLLYWKYVFHSCCCVEFAHESSRTGTRSWDLPSCHLLDKQIPSCGNRCTY